MKALKDYVITIPDFPTKGILFRDITGIISNAEGFKLSIDELEERLKGVEFDTIVGLESRGFIFGAPLAANFGKSFVPVRKKGKLPRATIEKSYALEYGFATIEIHRDAIKPGERVVVVDDLLATGGTANAACELIEELGGKVVKLLFVMELSTLKGRESLKRYDVESLFSFDGE